MPANDTNQRNYENWYGELDSMKNKKNICEWDGDCDCNKDRNCNVCGKLVDKDTGCCPNDCDRKEVNGPESEE